MPNTDTDSFGDRVRARLKAHGLTQTDLAHLMGVTPQAVQKLLATSNPWLETIERVAEALGCKPSDLVR